MNELNARPASKGQYGYAYALNSSRNHVVCHRVPSAADILQSGDIVNFDITLETNGYIADSSKTYLVGEVSPLAKEDGWTVVTDDGQLSAQSEHTVAVTRKGGRFLTLRAEEKRWMD